MTLRVIKNEGAVLDNVKMCYEGSHEKVSFKQLQAT